MTALDRIAAHWGLERARPVRRPADVDPTLLTAKPEKRDWATAACLLDHPSGCRCSTCDLAARLGRIIRSQNESRIPE
jgi:hypothetical protein